MSIYDTVLEIKNVDKSIEHNMLFDKDDVIAEFITSNNKHIKLFFSEYSTYKLKDLAKNYKSFKLRYQFWDPEFCDSDNLYTSDVDFLQNRIVNNLNVDKRVFISGFLKGMTKLYKCIKCSYNSEKFNKYKKNIGLDKNTISYLMTKLSLNIESMIYTEDMMDLIKRCVSDRDLVYFLVNNKFNMKSQNFKRLIYNTLMVDEISGILMTRHKNSLDRLLSHIDLIKGCKEITSPVVILEKSRSLLFYNIMNMDIDYDIDQDLYKELLNVYHEKGGEFDIKIMKKNTTIKTNLGFLSKEMYISSPS